MFRADWQRCQTLGHGTGADRGSHLSLAHPCAKHATRRQPMATRRRPDGPRISSRLRQRLTVVALVAIAVVPFQPLGSAAAASGPQLVTDPAALVNPLIGTSGAVDTFPGPDMPNGMIQWSPDTTPARTDGGGYEYN